MIICKTCNIEKYESEFYFRKDTGKYRTECIECRKKKQKEYYENNKEEINIRRRPYQTKYNEEHKQEHKEYYENNKEKKLKYQKGYYRKNKKQIRKKVRIYERNRRKADPEFKILKNLRTRLYKLLIEDNKTDSTINLIGCTLKQLKKHLESQFQEGMTWENYGIYGWHIDHIVPCSSFDLSDPEQQKECFHYTNLQPLWAEDNLKKGSKLIKE